MGDTRSDSLVQEYMDIVDYNGIPTGRKHPRGQKIDSAHGDYLRAVVVCILNQEGRMLIQKRQKDKRSWPDMWDISCGGAITAGEEPQVSGMREVSEELGLTLDLKEKRPALITTFRDGFTYTFVETVDVTLDDIVIQKEEVQAVALASKEEIYKMIEDGVFVPYRHAWIEYVFDFARQEFIF